MLIGAHVSPAGGLAKAIERGTERDCQAIQIFNQSPRMWRPTAYGEDDFQAFREAMASSAIKAVLIHAVYLLNCASEDPEIREKSLPRSSSRSGWAAASVPPAWSCTPDRPSRATSTRRSDARAR